MRLIPVLDVLNGAVVRGIGGRRSEYQPIISRLTNSTDPAEVASALIACCGARELYLADLDAIQGAKPNLDMYRAIRNLGVALWIDAGVRDCKSALMVVSAGCHVVAGLETVSSPNELREIVRDIGSDQVIFSFDLRGGVALRDSIDIAAAVAVGVKRIIVLDLARVGEGKGTGTERLCRQIASIYPNVEVIAGGGVAGADDLRRLEQCGVRGVLVASALHDGRLTGAEC